MKKRYFHKFVDEIMKDGKERSGPTIIDILKVTMRSKDIHGRSRAGYNIPVQGSLSYYLKINKSYIKIDNSNILTWKMEGN